MLPQRTAGKEHSGTGLISHNPKGRRRRKGPQTGSQRAVAADPTNAKTAHTSFTLRTAESSASDDR